MQPILLKGGNHTEACMIVFSHVRAGYPGKTVFEDLNLSLPERGAAALMAPSGFGKTTLLRLIAGLEKPQGGTIIGTAGKRIAFLFQEDRLLPWLTAAENVSLVSDPERAGHWLDAMEIAETGLYPREMSGGMQRRVALARCMAFGGDILLLDEPFKGLDDALRERVARQVRGQAPLTVLSIHDAQEAVLMDAETLQLDRIAARAMGSSDSPPDEES